VDSQLAEEILQMIGTSLNIRIDRYSNDKIEMGIYQLFVFSCDNILYIFNVLHGNLVAWIWHTCMAVLLLFKQRKFFFLVGDEKHLIIHYYLS